MSGSRSTKSKPQHFRYHRESLLKFDVGLMRKALEEVERKVSRTSPLGDKDVQATMLTQIPGDIESRFGGNVHGIFWTMQDGKEVPYGELIDEQAYTEFVPELEHTYFKAVVDELRQHYPIGRVRLLWKHPRTCLSYHRDPEPRLHLAIHTEHGARMVVANESFHIPADGHPYITNTRLYHTAYNGGWDTRVHLVATLPGFRL